MSTIFQWILTKMSAKNFKKKMSKAWFELGWQYSDQSEEKFHWHFHASKDKNYSFFFIHFDMEIIFFDTFTVDVNKKMRGW